VVLERDISFATDHRRIPDCRELLATERARRAGLKECEVVAVVLYTGPMVCHPTRSDPTLPIHTPIPTPPIAASPLYCPLPVHQYSLESEPSPAPGQVGGCESLLTTLAGGAGRGEGGSSRSTTLCSAAGRRGPLRHWEATTTARPSTA
jgi:hypothetical protein